jgi:Fur family transcriptional regulator, peroxide stress response regulator
VQRSPAHLKKRVDQMVERCREAGMNVTPQRMAVYKALLQSEEHPTPEMLYKRVTRKMPSVSLATIYKALDALESVGLVREVPVVSEKRRYDANDSPHHHLICSRCGSIRDYYSHDFDQLVPRASVQGFVAQGVSVNITGVCPACRHKAAER